MLIGLAAVERPPGMGTGITPSMTPSKRLARKKRIAAAQRGSSSQVVHETYRITGAFPPAELGGLPSAGPFVIIDDYPAPPTATSILVMTTPC